MAAHLQVRNVRADNSSHHWNRACVYLVFLFALSDSTSVSGAQLKFKVKENLPPGSVVGQVATEAPDSAPGAPVSYEIDNASPAASAFAVSSEGLLRTSLPLDRESVAVFNFNLIVRSSRRPGRSSTVPVEVEVADVNDNPPMILLSESGYSLKENGGFGDVVGSLRVHDRDAGDNGKLFYWIESIDSDADDAVMFGMSEGEEPEIIALQPLDREQKASYRFYVMAKDFGEPSLTSRTLVIIRVEDENDNVPVWVWPSPEGPGSVLSVSRKNLQIGQLLLRAVATDADEGESARLYYSIEMGDRSAIFDIDRYSGSVYILKMPPPGVDRYEMALIVSDTEEIVSHYSRVDVVVNVLP